MSDIKKNKKNMELDKASENEKNVVPAGKEAKKGESGISLVNQNDLIERETKPSLLGFFSGIKALNKEEEITVVNKKKTKGYAPTVFAIILFSALLLTNVVCQVTLDGISNDMATMNKQLAEYKAAESVYSEKLAKKDEAVLEGQKEYIEGEMGMVKEDPEKVYVELQLDDEITVVEMEEEPNCWTTLLSGMGRFFSDIFG